MSTDFEPITAPDSKIAGVTRRGPQKGRQATFLAETPLPPSEPAKEPQEPAADTGADAPKAYDETELMAIFDAIIFEGEYSEQVTIRGKFPVVFRSRTSEEIRAISAALDLESQKTILMSTIQERRSMLNLESALVQYGSTQIAGMNAEGRSKFMGKIPAPMIGVLLMELSRFDAKVFAACKEGEANF
jgi:hypothetical protein